MVDLMSLSPQARILVHLSDLLPVQTAGKPSKALALKSIAIATGLPDLTAEKVLREFELKGFVEEKRVTFDEVVKFGSKFEVIYSLTLKGVQEAEQVKKQIDKSIIKVRIRDKISEMEVREAMSYIERTVKLPVEMNYTFLLKSIREGNYVDINSILASIGKIYPFGPRPSIEYFFGREEELKELREFMRGDGKILCITGIGGSGKSALINHFAPGTGREIFWYTFDKATSLRVIMDKIGEFLYKLNKPKFLEFVRKSPELNLIDAFLLLGEELRGTNSLLIFDRIERASPETGDFFSHLKNIIEDIDVKCILSGRQIRRFWDVEDIRSGIVREMKIEGLDQDSSDKLLSLMNIDKQFWNRLYQITKGYPGLLQRARPTTAGKIDDYIFTDLLRGLSVKEEQALRVASVFRFPFNARAILEVGYDLNTIRNLEDRGLLEKVGEEEYLVEDVIRERMYQEQSPPRRADNHKIAARYYSTEKGTQALLEKIYHNIMGENAREVLPDAIRKGGSIIDEGYPEEFLDVLKRLEKMEGLSPKILSYLFFHEGHAYYVLGDYEKAIKANKQALEYADSELKPRISRWLGDTYQLINNPDAALSAYDESLKYASPTVAVELVSRKANVYSAIGDMKRALKTIKRAQSKVKKCKNPSTVAEVHNLSGLIYLSLWRAEEARKSLQLAYNISEKYRNMRNLCNSHMYMSQVYYQLRGYEGANRSSEAAYRIGSKIGYIPALAGIYVIQAPLLKDAGDITGSSDNLFRGVRLAKSRNARQWLAEAYMFLGDIFRTFGEMKNATGYANLAIDWSEKIKDKQTWGEAILRKGVFQIEMANIKEGRKNLKRGIRILKKNKCKRNKAWIKIQLSEANYAQKKLKSSIKNLQGAIKILEKLSNRKELYLAYISIAVKSMEMNNMEEAKEYLDKARKVAGENSWYEEAVYSIAYIHFQILQGEKMGDRIESLSVDLREKGYIVDMANLFYHASLAYKVIDNPDWRTFSRKAADVYESIGLSQYLNLVPNPKREAEKKE